MDLILRLLALAGAVLLVALLVPGVRIRGFKAALAVSAVYGLLNFVLFKLLIFITFPLLILKYLTLGLFGVVINAVLLMITDKVLDGFEIDSFKTALIAGALISVANLLIGIFL